MEYPKNCWECQHSKNCQAPHYGGSKCKHADAINRAVIAAARDQNAKGGKHNGN